MFPYIMFYNSPDSVLWREPAANTYSVGYLETTTFRILPSNCALRATCRIHRNQRKHLYYVICWSFPFSLLDPISTLPCLTLHAGKPHSPLTTGFWVSSASGRHWGTAGGEMREKLGLLAGISSLTAPAALQWPGLISGGTPHGLAPAGQPRS